MNEERLGSSQLRKMEKAYPIMDRIRQGIMIDPINLQKAIALECSPESENSILLYRGSRFQNEPLYDQGDPYCPCFGMSLFAGFMKDANACAGARMFFGDGTVCSYSLRIPLRDHWQDAFCIPRVSTICGLISRLENFHARAKCLPPKGQLIRGYTGGVNDEARTRLVSPLSYSELDTQLKKYQEQRIEFALDPKRKRGYVIDG
jgi:hypothetical protein